MLCSLYEVLSWHFYRYNQLLLYLAKEKNNFEKKVVCCNSLILVHALLKFFFLKLIYFRMTRQENSHGRKTDEVTILPILVIGFKEMGEVST